MMPYFSCPFVYYGRNSKMMPPVPMPMPMPQQVSPTAEQPVMPTNQQPAMMPTNLMPMQTNQQPMMPTNLMPMQTNQQPMMPTNLMPMQTNQQPMMPTNLMPMQTNQQPMMPTNLMPMETNQQPMMMPTNLMPMQTNQQPMMMPTNLMPMQTNQQPTAEMPETSKGKEAVSPEAVSPNMKGMPTETAGTEKGNVSPASKKAGDPPPILSNNPPTSQIALHKELTGYPNYGNPSRNADILYTGTRGAWTFDVPPFLFVPGNLTAQVVLRAVLDDHANVPTRNYSARITINGTTVHNGRLNLEHGVPAGTMFDNWRLLTFNIPNLRRNNRIEVENTSTAGANDWIALDWIELRAIPR